MFIFYLISGFLLILVAFLWPEKKRIEAEANRFREDYHNSNKEASTLRQREKELEAEIKRLHSEYDHHYENLRKLQASNLSSMPWLAGMMADYLTYDLEIEAKKLDWGSSIQRQKKVASLRDIRADAKRRIEEAKIATYQLEYLLSLYPGLSDVLETDFSELDFSGKIPDHDPTRDWLSLEEWSSLSQDERDQLALDRYVQSRKKSKWQIGRDYELSVAYEFSQQGYIVDSTGNYMKLEDMGRDIIAVRGSRTYIIQCKYWSKDKTIHEKHIFQLYGTSVLYSLDHPALRGKVTPVFVTNILLSETARKVAESLKITVYENHPFTEFPRIKCNIGRDEYGETKIYHLPMDLQYDITQIKNAGECYAFTVKEATDKGFRRAYKWHGN